MTATRTSRRRRLVATFLAGSLAVAGLAPAAASARVWDSDYLPIYTLSGGEKVRVCHEFTGTMLYPDGYRVNCATGAVYFTPPPTS
jgi:hypothetical protein